MSFNARENRVTSLQFEPNISIANIQKPSALSGPTEGLLYLDSLQKSFGKSIGGLGVYGHEVANVNVTPTTGPNGTTTETAFATFTFPGGPNGVYENGGAINAVGKTVYIWAAGLATTSATTFTPTIKLRLGGVVGPPPTGTSLISIASGALTLSQTNLPWQFEAYVTVQAVNAAGGTGVVEAHGLFSIALTAPTAALSSYADQNTATVTVGDLTTSQLFTLSAALSNGTATNAMTVRQQIIEVLS